MFRTWLSNFASRNKEKIGLLLKTVSIVLLALFILYVIFFNRGKETSNVEQAQTIYKPQETIISGSNINKEEYQEDSSIVENFVEYCNEKNIDDAYNLLTDECKQNLYPTLEDFKEKYCSRYFSEKREYNLQSWIKKGKTVTYQMRITQDILSSGEYQSGSSYQDYITIVDVDNGKKININGYICKKDINKTSSSDGIDVKINMVDVYMNYEEYTIEVTNNTENVIMMDNMMRPRDSLRIISGDENSYSVMPNSISYIELIVNPGENRKMKIQFNKKYTEDSDSKYLVFSKVVKNYNQFIKNQIEYNNLALVGVEI